MVTLFNRGSAQMSVMALGKAIDWNPKTTLNVTEEEAEKLLKIETVVKFEDISGDKEGTSSLLARIAELEKENQELKAKTEDSSELDRDALKAKAKELGIDFAKNIKTEDLAKLIEGK